MVDIIENGNVNVHTIMDNLHHVELSQYAVGGELSDGHIPEENYPRVMSAINRAVNKIQQDLSIHENTVYIVIDEYFLTYPLHSKHSIVNGTDSRKFIDDSPYSPFEDDILQIRDVFNKEGSSLPINTRNNTDSIYIPQHNVIQHPYGKNGDVLGIVYSRYTKPKVVESPTAAQDIYLPIPDYTLPALYAYVASLLTVGLVNENEITESQVWMNEYISLIEQMKQRPALPTASYENTKLTDNGFI